MFRFRPLFPSDAPSDTSRAQSLTPGTSIDREGIAVTKAIDRMLLTGKVAIVTGGAGGIGQVYCRALCEVGAAEIRNRD